MNTRLWRRFDVMEHYGIKESTLYKWLREGKIPPPRKRIGRVPFWFARDFE